MRENGGGSGLLHHGRRRDPVRNALAGAGIENGEGHGSLRCLCDPSVAWAGSHFRVGGHITCAQAIPPWPLGEPYRPVATRGGLRMAFQGLLDEVGL
jgi:hypothetical protein